MGHGLAMKKGGNHVAFTAGTGIYVYMDLVTHLARKMMGTLSEKEGQMVNDDFKFTLYASFQSRERSIALSFLENVNQLN
jgi:hypothetical protein